MLCPWDILNPNNNEFCVFVDFGFANLAIWVSKAWGEEKEKQHLFEIPLLSIEILAK